MLGPGKIDMQIPCTMQLMPIAPVLFERRVLRAQNGMLKWVAPEDVTGVGQRFEGHER